MRGRRDYLGVRVESLLSVDTIECAHTSHIGMIIILLLSVLFPVCIVLYVEQRAIHHDKSVTCIGFKLH